MTSPPRWRRRSRRAISDGPHLERSARTDIEAYLDQHEHKSLLRFITCGSVDDGKCTLIGRLLHDTQAVFDDQLSALESGLARRSAPRAATRLRAAGRWPRRRARAGHHHRCRLPVLLDRETQVHRRRHPGPRAVHPEHGDRRVHRRCRGDPDRRPQRRAHPDPPPQLPRVAAGHPPCGAGRQQDRSGRLRPGGVRRDRRRLPGLRRRDRPRRRSPASPCRRCTATTSPSRRPTRRGTTGRRWSGTSSRSRSTTSSSPARSACRCSGSTGPNLDFRGFSGQIAGGSVRPGDRSGWRPSGRESTVARIVTQTAISTRPWPDSRSPSRLADEVDISRGDVLAAGLGALRVGRPVRVPPGLDGRGRNGPRAPVPAEDRGPHGHRDRRPTEVQGQRQHPRAHRRRRPSSSTRSGCATSTSTRPSRSIRTRRTATLGRLHPHRPVHQRHGRRRTVALRPPAGRQCALAGRRGRP